MAIIIRGGFLPSDFGYAPEPTVDFRDLDKSIKAIDDSPLSPEAEEAKELYDFIERSSLFDAAMEIDRHPAPGDSARCAVLWAARRNLAGVKLPTKEQIIALWNAQPQVKKMIVRSPEDE